MLVRAPVPCVSGNSVSGNARRSSTWIVRRSDSARPATVSRVADMVSPMLVTTGSVPYRATSRRTFPSRRKMSESMPPQTRAAFSATTSRTGCRSVGELAMTRRISAVAVCCSSDSVTCAWASVSARFFCCSSVNRRTFSMAMTAWSAKVWSRAICFSVNGRTLWRRIEITPIAIPSRSSGTASSVSPPLSRTCAGKPGNSS